MAPKAKSVRSVWGSWRFFQSCQSVDWWFMVDISTEFYIYIYIYMLYIYIHSVCIYIYMYCIHMYICICICIYIYVLNQHADSFQHNKHWACGNQCGDVVQSIQTKYTAYQWNVRDSLVPWTCCCCDDRSPIPPGSNHVQRWTDPLRRWNVRTARRVLTFTAFGALEILRLWTEWDHWDSIPVPRMPTVCPFQFWGHIGRYHQIPNLKMPPNTSRKMLFFVSEVDCTRELCIFCTTLLHHPDTKERRGGCCNGIRRDQLGRSVLLFYPPRCRTTGKRM